MRRNKKTLIKTRPGKYPWLNSQGIPGLDNMEIGEITIFAFEFGFGVQRIFEITLEDGKRLYLKTNEVEIINPPSSIFGDARAEGGE